MKRPLGKIDKKLSTRSDWKNLRVAVVGLGKSGLAALEVLNSLGVKVTGFDNSQTALTKAESEVPGAGLSLAKDAQELGILVEQSDPDLVVISPGIPAHHPVYQLNSRLPIWSEVELAWQLQLTSSGVPNRPWLTLTGTNGKTTTVGMVSQILQTTGEKALAVGNVGEPVVLAAVSDQAETLAVELSSFQLHTTYSVSAEASVVLNLDDDHVDWHQGIENYWAAKAQIHQHTQKAVIYNHAYPHTLEQVLAADVVEGARAVGITTQVPDIYQLGVVEELLVDRAFVARPHKEAAALVDFAGISHLSGGKPTVALLEDVLAASALTRAHGVEPEAIAAGLAEFKLAAHRRQVVGMQTGVTWINDSKATNAHAAANSLAGAAPQSVVWIAGGDAKGQDFHDLVQQVAPVLRGVILIGVDKTPLRTALAEVAPQIPTVELEPHEELMTSVVHEAVALSRPGDQVILAPACASWDQFKDYGERGDRFAAAVNLLDQ